MKVLVDTNVVVDFLLARPPFAKEAEAMFQRFEKRTIDGLICATTVTTTHYLHRKALGSARAIGLTANLLRLLDVAPVTRAVLEAALRDTGKDFEDNVLIACARVAGVDAVVTRDAAGLSHGGLPVFTPAELLSATRE